MKYLIWSNEHNSWWKANSAGYTDYTHLAGRYTKQQAIGICNDANFTWDTDKRSKIPDELPVEESIAIKLKYKIYGKDYKEARDDQ